MTTRDEQDLATWREFFQVANGNFPERKPNDVDDQRMRAVTLCEQLILRFGQMPTDDVLLAYAKQDASRLGFHLEFGEYSDSTKDVFLRSAKIHLATIPDDVYVQLANATAIATCSAPLSSMSESIAQDWIWDAKIAIHVPPRFWDERYVMQNVRGMERLLTEKL